MKDFMYAADTKEAWDAFAVANGLGKMVPIDPDQEDSPTIIQYSGCTVDEIGAIVTSPAEYDYNQEPPVLLNPAVIDERHHVNVRISDGSIPALEGEGVVWIDPDSVTTPQRIFLGGMDYYKPE